MKPISANEQRIGRHKVGQAMDDGCSRSLLPSSRESNVAMGVAMVLLLRYAALFFCSMWPFTGTIAQTEAWPDYPRRLDYEVYYSSDRPATSSMTLIGPGEYVTKGGQKITTDGFYMLDFEVSNKEYSEFIDYTGHRPPDFAIQREEGYAFQQIFAWRGNHYPPGRAGFPVMNISYDDASAFCSWRSQITGMQYRLPTFDEYQIATSFINVDNAHCLVSSRHWHVGPDPVYGGSKDQTRNGIHFLMGNVREWIFSEFPETIVSSYGCSYVEEASLCAPAPTKPGNHSSPDLFTGFRYVIPLRIRPETNADKE